MQLELELKKERKKIRKITAGTREWSDHSLNCFLGCSNDCKYCYAKKMAIRFGRKTESNWKQMVLREKVLNKQFRKREGRFMFPTSHDIVDDPKVIQACFKLLKTVLEPGNQVLITTKPRHAIIKTICEEFDERKSLIQFRFTITSNDDRLLRFWEPGAPSYKERIKALRVAHEFGYKTSISIEPFLSDPSEFIEDLIPLVSESIWVGPMNYARRNGIKSSEKSLYQEIRTLNQPENLLKIYKKLKKYKVVRFKDSLLIRLYNAGLLELEPSSFL